MFIMLYFSNVSALNSRKLFEKIKTAFGEIDLHHPRFWLSMKSFCQCVHKISWHHSFCRFLVDIWFHTKSKNGANNINIWSQQSKCQRYNDALQYQERNVWLTRWWNWLLQHCHSLLRFWSCMSTDQIKVDSLTFKKKQTRSKRYLAETDKREYHRWYRVFRKFTCTSQIPLHSLEQEQSALVTSGIRKKQSR